MPGNMVHAGGLLQDATLLRQTPLIARAVFAPKHAGATNVLRVCAALLFSLRTCALGTFRDVITSCISTHDGVHVTWHGITLLVLARFVWGRRLHTLNVVVPVPCPIQLAWLYAVFGGREMDKGWQACMGVPLAGCLLFSSVAALTGPPGSASYAAANAALDVLAAGCLAQGVLACLIMFPH